MAPVGAERQRVDTSHRARRQRRVEMREELSPSRLFPSQRIAECGGVDGQEHEPVLSRAVLGGALLHLRRSRKVNEAVRRILRRARVASARGGALPFLASANVIDRARTHPRRTLLAATTRDKRST